MADLGDPEEFGEAWCCGDGGRVQAGVGGEGQVRLTVTSHTLQFVGEIIQKQSVVSVRNGRFQRFCFY